MKQVECNTCGETTWVYGRGERGETSKETPMEHLERTGHDPRMRAGERRSCGDCGNVWWYQGDADRPTCPSCKGKNNYPTEKRDVTEQQVELLKTVTHIQEIVDDDTAKTFVLACKELREGNLSGAANDLEYVAHRLNEAVEE